MSIVKTRHSSISTSALPKPNILNHFAKQPQSSRTYLTSLSSLKKKSILQPQSSIQIPEFVPRNRTYIQLSPEKSEINLRSLVLEKQKKKIENFISDQKIAEKVSLLKSEIKSFNLKSDRFGLLDKLEDLKTPPNKPRPNEIRSFFSVIKSGDLQKVAEILQANPSLTLMNDNLKQTALHWACRRGYLEIAKLLVKYKLSSGQQDVLGRSPEDIARKKGHKEILEYFSSIKRFNRHLSMRFY